MPVRVDEVGAPVGVGEPVYLDVPQVNAFAVGLAHRHEMREVFGTARMYLGPRPKIAESRVYGITTFELG